MTAHRIGFLIWPSTKALTLALAEEALRVAQRVHPEVVYELLFLQAEAPLEGAWQLPGEPWNGKLEGCQKLFLLADEPPAALTSALDPELVGEVLKVMQDLALEGRTMVVVTHEMGFAREVSNQLVFLHKGIVEESGDPREVLVNPQCERLQQFLSGSLK